MPVVIAVLVFAGIGVSALVNVWIESPDARALPGVALGSQTVLAVERFLALLAAWLLVLVVSAQALKGGLAKAVFELQTAQEAHEEEQRRYDV